MDSSSQTDIARLKWRFVELAKTICPGFTVRDEMKDTYADIFDWCIASPESRYDPDRGLWLWGDIGTGKTTMLEIVKEFCKIVRPYDDIDGSGYLVPYSFRISNAIQVCGEFSRFGYDGLETFIQSGRQAFDELGSEAMPTSYFGTVENVFQYLLQRRYDNRFRSFTHVTTNLTVDEIAERYGARIYDRCKEMFNFIELRGATWRKRNTRSVGAQRTLKK